MSHSETIPKKVPIVRDREFAKRLEAAIYGHSQAPDGHGRQKWLRERIESRFNTKVSPEAVRKWFGGEARPRPKLMSQIANVLEVDEAWLSLGLKPDSTPAEKQRHSVTTTGAANLVAGMIQMNGGHIAFPDDANGNVDIYAIIGGKQHSLLVRTAKEHNGQLKVIVPTGHERSVVMLVLREAPTSFSVVRLMPELINGAGDSKGGYLELEITGSGSAYYCGKEPLPTIVSFDNLEGERPLRRKS